MNFIKRAFLSVKAKKGKSLLQLFVFTVICVLVLSGLSIQSAALTSAELAKQQLGGTVTLSFDQEKMMQEQREARESAGSEENREPFRFSQTPVEVEDAEELTTLSQLSGYNFTSSTQAVASNFDPIETSSNDTSSDSNPMGGRMPDMGMADADVTLQGVVFTDATTDFMDRNAEMVEGTHISDEHIGENVAIIEETLAEENDLSVGDTIKVASSSDEDKTVKAEIIGIYKTTSTSTDPMGMSFTSMNPYNQIYVPYTLANEIKGEDYEGTIDSATYYMADPADTEAFIEDAEAMGVIDLDTYKLDANDDLYQQMVEPINNVASFSKNIVYLVTIAGAIILGLIVMLGIRERKYEMGVLLAIGEKKGKLIGQFIVEILIIAVFAIGIASLTGNVVADKIGDQLLSQQEESSANSRADALEFGGRGMQMGPPGGFGAPGGFGGPGQPNNQADADVQAVDLNVQVTGADLGKLAGIGLLIAVIATLIPSLSVIRLQPKAILSRQD